MKKLLVFLILATTVLAQNTKSKTLSVTVSPQAPHTVTLSWNHEAPAGLTYNIYRKINGDTNFTSIKTGNTTLTYVDTTVLSSITYQYQVTAQDSSGVESSPSNTATAVIPNP
jgi:fibronectin type 3 domain-containing protein